MDTIGRIGFSVESMEYKLCAIKVSKKDGSVYIGFSFGSYHANQGITGQKITYHPDGNTWLTADLQEKIVGQDFIDAANSAQMIGLNFNNRGHVYVKGQDYEKQPSFNDIEREKLVVELRNGAQLFDIHHNNDYSSNFATENNPTKRKMTNILRGEDYFGMKNRFFLVANDRCTEFESAVQSNDSLVAFGYPHPLRSITVFATVENSMEQPKKAT